MITSLYGQLFTRCERFTCFNKHRHLPEGVQEAAQDHITIERVKL
jgi:hypothetical protein